MGIPNALANQLQSNSRSTSEKTNNEHHLSKPKLAEQYEDYHPQGFEGHMSRQKQSHVVTSTLPQLTDNHVLQENYHYKDRFESGKVNQFGMHQKPTFNMNRVVPNQQIISMEKLSNQKQIPLKSGGEKRRNKIQLQKDRINQIISGTDIYSNEPLQRPGQNTSIHSLKQMGSKSQASDYQSSPTIDLHNRNQNQMIHHSNFQKQLKVQESIYNTPQPS